MSESEDGRTIDARKRKKKGRKSGEIEEADEGADGGARDPKAEDGGGGEHPMDTE